MRVQLRNRGRPSDERPRQHPSRSGSAAAVPAPAPRAVEASPGPFVTLSQYTGFAPAMVLFGVFFAAPMALIVAYSFWTQEGYNVVSHWTFANYQEVFSTPVYVNTFLVTLWMTAAATFLTLAIAFPFAYWLARYVSRRWQRPLAVPGHPAVLGDATSCASPRGRSSWVTKARCPGSWAWSASARRRGCSTTGRRSSSCWCTSISRSPH